MEQEEPIDVDELRKNAYRDAYDNPIKFDGGGGIHSDSWPRVRRFAGNEDRGYGTFTASREVDIKTKHGVRTIETDQLIDDVVRSMIEGSRDKIEGKEPNPEIMV